MFTFVTEGIEKALELARATIGSGSKNVLINGGANTIRRFVKAGLASELHIQLVPLLLGGTSLFGTLGTVMELEKVNGTDEENVRHLTY